MSHSTPSAQSPAEVIRTVDETVELSSARRGTRRRPDCSQTLNRRVRVDLRKRSAPRPRIRPEPRLGHLPEGTALLTAGQFRVFLFSFALLLALAVVLSYRNINLEQRVFASEARYADSAAQLIGSRNDAPHPRGPDGFKPEIENLLTAALERLSALEERSGAASRVIGGALPSIMFLQVAYRFEDEDTRQPLRYLVGPNGEPLLTPGGPAMSIKGTGPVVERQLTGTAFVATSDRLLITNRHVVRPWEDDEAATILKSRGFEPVMYRLLGYLPGKAEPIDVELVALSDEADIAILKSDELPPEVPYLELSSDAPRAGEPVVVMGYPTGMQALLARADHQLVEALRQDQDFDFWRVARELSDNDNIHPLASLGIVGQVTRTFVVYDAETAQGGSGGPVLGLDGRVIAINSAIIPGFNGSNMGVPMERVVSLLGTLPQSTRG